MAGGGDIPRYQYEVGAAAVVLLDQDFDGLFKRSIPLTSLTGGEGSAGMVDLILVPRFESLAASYLLGIDVFAPDGIRIARIENWAMSPPVPEQSGITPLAKPLPAVNDFLIDAAGDLATALILSPEITVWSAGRGLEWQWPDVRPRDIAGNPRGVVIVSCMAGLRRCNATEDTVAVGDALRRLDRTIDIVSAADLRRALYPWLGWADMSDTQLAEWLRRPAVAARVGAMGIRYLVFADSLGASTKRHGEIGAVGGYGGGGLFGLMWWTRNEVGRLNVFDFVTAAEAGKVNHQREDVTFALPALIIPMPIPIPRQVEDMPDAIAKQLLPLVRPLH